MAASKKKSSPDSTPKSVSKAPSNALPPFTPGMDPLTVGPPTLVTIAAALASFSAEPLSYDQGIAEADLGALRPRLTAIPADRLSAVRVDVAATARALFGVYTFLTKAPVVRAELEKLASIERFDMGQLELLRALAFTLQYAQQKAESAGAFKTDAKIPAALDTEAVALEAVMQKVCEHNLEDDAEYGPVLVLLSAGSGHLDRANDLLGYADIYVAKHGIVSKDTHYEDTHVASARRVAGAIIGHLGAAMSPQARQWYDVLQRAFALLTPVYAEVREVALGVLRFDPQRQTRLPSLYAAGRPGQGRPRKKKVEPPPTAPTG